MTTDKITSQSSIAPVPPEPRAEHSHESCHRQGQNGQNRPRFVKRTALILDSITEQVRDAILRTQVLKCSIELSLLFEGNVPHVRIQTTATLKNILKLTPPEVEADPDQLVLELAEIENRVNSALITIGERVDQIFKEIDSERHSGCVELILIFKRAQLMGLRRVENSKIGSPN